MVSYTRWFHSSNIATPFFNKKFGCMANRMNCIFYILRKMFYKTDNQIKEKGLKKQIQKPYNEKTVEGDIVLNQWGRSRSLLATGPDQTNPHSTTEMGRFENCKINRSSIRRRAWNKGQVKMKRDEFQSDTGFVLSRNEPRFITLIVTSTNR